METSGSKTKKRRGLWAAAIVLVLAAGAVLLCCTVRIGGHFYRRSEQIDAREAELSAGEYDAAATALPDSEIRWSVPIGNERFDSFSETLTLSSLPEEDVAMLLYFPYLKAIDATRCADCVSLAEAASLLPQTEIRWYVPSPDGQIDGSAGSLAVKGLSDGELRALLPLLPRLRELDLRGSSLSEAEADALAADYPALALKRSFLIWGERVDGDAEELDLSNRTGEIAELTAHADTLGALKRISFGGRAVGAADYAALRRAFPEASLDCRASLYGLDVDPQTDAIDLHGVAVSDTAELEALLDVLPGVKKVDMCGCGLSDEEMEGLNARHPGVDLVWMITFGGGRYTVRTDLVSFSSLRTHFGEVQHRFTDEEMAPLFRYCRHLRALDLGHNYLRDITPIGNLRELKILILGDNPYLEDLSPIGELTELEYLELFNSHRDYDFSFLYRLTKMQYLNLGFLSELDDVGYLEVMPELKMFWLRGTGVPDEVAAACEKEYPEVLFHYGNCGWEASATCHGWRRTETNILVRTLFRSWRDVIAIEGLDDVRFDPDADVIYCIPLDA